MSYKQEYVYYFHNEVNKYMPVVATTIDASNNTIQLITSGFPIGEYINLYVYSNNDSHCITFYHDGNFIDPIVIHSNQADITVITDQKFSRYPCQVIINKIQEQLDKCSNLYLCLNRHYINIDNSYHDSTLDENFNMAIVQWLKKNLPNAEVIDLSLNYVDYGQHFTWALPDRNFFIRKLND